MGSVPVVLDRSPGGIQADLASAHHDLEPSLEVVLDARVPCAVPPLEPEVVSERGWPPTASGTKWSSSYLMASPGGSPALVSISFLSAWVYDVDGRTVAVHPGTQIVLWTLACVMSAENAPGGSWKGERLAGGALLSDGRAAVASGMAGRASGGTDAHAVSKSASAAATASATRLESSGRTGPIGSRTRGLNRRAKRPEGRVSGELRI